MEKLIQIVAICHLFTSCITSEVHVDLIDDIPRSNRGPLKDTSPLNLKSFGGSVYDSIKLGTLIYQSKEDKGISIIDITSPITPSLEETQIYSPAYSLRKSSNVLYIASGEEGLSWYDISNPITPTKMGNIQFDNTIKKIELHNNYLILINGLSVEFFDISTSSDPQKIGTYIASNTIHGMSFKNNHGFIYELGLGLQTIDLTDPSNIATVGTPLVVAGVISNVHFKISNNHIIAGISYGSIYGQISSIDISDPLNAAVADSELIYNRGQILDLKLDGNDAYLGTGKSLSGVIPSYATGVDVFDISDPTNMVFKGHFKNDTTINSLIFDGSNILASNGTGGLSIYDRTSFSKSPELVDTLDSSSFTNDIELFNSPYLVIADGANGLRVVNSSSPTSLSYTGTENTPGHAYEVEVGVTHAYLADLTGGFHIIDLSTPSAPNTTGTYPGNVYDVKVNSTETRAYIINLATPGIDIINITNKSAPVLINTISFLTGGIKFEILDDDLVVSNGTGFDIIDVTTDEMNPSVIGSITNVMDSVALDIETDGNRLYATTDESFFAFDISSKAAPAFLGEFSKGNWSNQGFNIINSNYALLGGFGEYLVLDLSDITKIKEVWHDHDPSGFAYDAVTDGNYVYMANSFTGIKVYNISEFPKLKTGGIDIAGDITKLFLDGDQLYFTDSNFGVGLIDYTNKEKPLFVTHFKKDLVSLDLFKIDNQVLTADSDGAFTLIDYSNKQAPNILSTSGDISGYQCSDVHVVDQELLCAHKNLGIRTYDLSNPLSPVRSSTIYSGNIETFLYFDKYVYTAEKTNGFTIFDAQDILNPIELSTYDTIGGVVAIAKHSKEAPFLYLADSSNGLLVFDITDKTSPILIRTIPPTGTSILNVKVFNDFLFVKDNSDGILIFDVSNPSVPVLISTVKTTGSMNDFIYHEKVLYIADGKNGITLVNLENPEKPIISY